MSDTLRTRMLSSAVTLIGEVGYARITVDRVVRLSGSSEETFYKCFADLDDCLLAAFEDALRRIAAVVVPAYEAERGWPAKVRAAVAALLAILDDEPAMSMFVFVGALGAGPKVLACRMEALERLKLAFEDGIDEGVDGRALAESSPLSAEGVINGVLGILHTRLLEGSPLARRPLSELAGPLTAMIVLPYLGCAAAAREVSAGRTSSSNRTGALLATNASNGTGRPASKVRPKAGAPKRKRARLTAKQRKLVAALEDGPRTVRELVDATGLSDQTARQSLNRLEAREKVVKTERDGLIAYELPSKGRAAAGRKVAAGSSTSNGAARSNGAGSATSNGTGGATSNGAGPSNGTGALAATSASNGAGSSASNGAEASNGHDRSARAKEMLRGLDPPISEREFKVLAAIGELNGRGSSSSNREIRDATELEDPAEVSKLLKQLARLGLVQSTATGRQTYAWRLTSKGTDLLRKLEGQAVGGTHPADARA